MPDRDVEFNLNAKDSTGPAVKGAADGFEKLGDKADKATRKIDDLGQQSGQLTRKLAEARVAAAALAREFDKTGDSKILKDFEKINREAAKLGRVMKTIKIDEPKQDEKKITGMFQRLVEGAKKAGILAGDATVEGIGDAFKALPGEAKVALVGSLVGVAVVAAPFVASAIEGAVVAGVGAAGIGAGIALAAQDPKVQQAYALLGGRVMDKLQKAAAPFTVALLAAPTKLSDAFERELPGIERTLGKLATNVGPILDNALKAVHELLPGIEQAAAAAGPILRQFSAQLPALFGAVSQLMSAFAAAGPAGGDALANIVMQLTLMIQLFALSANAAAPFLNLIAKLAEVTGQVPKADTAIQGLGRTLAGVSSQAYLAGGSYSGLSSVLGNTADQADALNDSFNRLFNEQMNLDAANLAVKQGVLNLKEAIKANGQTLDETSQKGLNNVGVVQAQIQNYERARQAAIDAGNGTVEATNTANAAYATQIEGLRRLLYSLGLNHAEVDRLIGAYAELGKPQTKTFTTVFRTIGSPGQSDSATGHSRTGTNDLGGLDGWAPAAFTASRRDELAGAGNGGGGYAGPPVQLNAEHAFSVTLDGAPFRAIAIRTVNTAEKRTAWRAKVGKR